MNDTGFGNPVGVLVTTNPAKGTATVTTAPGPVTGQVISYTANVGATGVDTFVYTVDDGLNIDSATVTINISAPDAVNDGPVSAMQFLPTLVPVGANDRGFSDPVTVTVTDLPEHGTITAISGAGPAATRTITYRSDASYLGADSFVYTMTDGNSSDTAQVTVAVVPDTTPGARDDNANAFSGVPLAINVRANDLGFDSGAALGIQTNPLHGAAVVGGTPGAQTIVYTSDADFHGIDTFEYTIDGVSLSDTALVTVMVALDADHDGIEDGIDNCLGAANPGQQDTDTDGFGNWCDADFNNDGRVNYADLAEFRSKFGGTDAEANLDSVGPVNFADLARFKALFGKPPGPSGQVP